MSAGLPRFVALAGEATAVTGGLELAGPACAVRLEATRGSPIPRLLGDASRVTDVRRLLAGGPRRQARLRRGLLAGLLEAGVLSAVVPALERIRVVGPAQDARHLRSCLGGAWLPAATPKVTTALLGRLGAPAWFESAKRLPGKGWTVPLSWEGEGCWVGPLGGAGFTPCVRCLLLRREAVIPLLRRDARLVPPRPWVALAAAVLGMAESGINGGTGEVRLVRSLETTTHRLLGSGLCESCSPTSARPLDEQATRRGDAFTRRWSEEPSAEPGSRVQAAFLDPMLASLSQSLLFPPDGFRDLPLVVGGVSTHQWTPEGPRQVAISNNLNGSGFSLRRRQLVQFCEGVERLALLSQRPDVRAVPRAQLGELALDPAEVAGFSQAQQEDAAFPFARHEGQPLDWAWTFDLTRKSPCLVPFDAVAVGRGPQLRKTRLMDEPFYTGGAAHVCVPKAVSHALLELVERDAFMLAWYLRLPLAELEVDAACLARDVAEALEFLGRRELELRFYDLSVDFRVPTVLAIATATAPLGRWVKGGRILSGCAAPTAAGAVGRCVSEVLGQVTAVTRPSDGGPATGNGEAASPDEWSPILERYLRQPAPEAFAHLGRARARLETRDDLPPNADLAAWLIAKLGERGLRVCVRLLDGPEVRAAGLSVVKVVVPGLVRPARSRAEVNFGSGRFAEVAARWGVSPTLNPLEHPLA